jgi:hypothetical protein
MVVLKVNSASPRLAWDRLDPGKPAPPSDGTEMSHTGGNAGARCVI